MRNIREEAKWSAENLPVIEKWLDNYINKADVKDDQYIKKLQKLTPYTKN